MSKPDQTQACPIGLRLRLIAEQILCKQILNQTVQCAFGVGALPEQITESRRLVSMSDQIKHEQMFG